MMQTCPKCGFVQPEDQYCAQCGCNIANFKPVQAPFLKRTLGNPSLQIGAIVVVILAITLAIFLSQKNRIEQRLAEAIPHVKAQMGQRLAVQKAAPAPEAPTAAPETSTDGPGGAI